MKIYAANTAQDFDKYVGKDIWVKCYFAFNPESQMWARFISNIFTSDSGVSGYLCDTVSDWALNNPNSTIYTGRNRPFVDYGHVIYSDQTKLAYPIETKSTEELFSLVDYTFENNAFDRFVGKNLWIKAYKEAADKNLPYEYYINIESKEGNVINYSQVDASYIDNIELCEDSWGPPSESIMESHRTSFTDIWGLCDPLEVLTDNEMNDLIDECDQYWEDHHEEDEEDWDEEE